MVIKAAKDVPYRYSLHNTDKVHWAKKGLGALPCFTLYTDCAGGASVHSVCHAKGLAVPPPGSLGGGGVHPAGSPPALHDQ